MNVALEKLIDRISSYDFLNNIIPGAIYIILIERFTTFKFLSGQILKDLFIVYFSGVILSRIASVFIEPLFIKIGVIKLKSYYEFIEAEKKDKKIYILSAVNNMYRAIISTLLSSLLTMAFHCFWKSCDIDDKCCKTIVLFAGLLFLSILFSLAYKKQTLYITKRVEKANIKE